ncbi:hypothetical protein FB460_0678 [Propioniferax innocua]|uniref:Uncharacterized protein n=2 Tax=Propioniferax innocua TaxID=1753 RepID=A0A542ZRE2_9ACTN|nr:hypothetical protein FB460_0678 [Propioniferax innocua]
MALIMSAAASMLIGLNAGLTRLAVPAPVDSVELGTRHGPIMVFGFMGSLIALERAQALRNPLAYLAPALMSLGALALAIGPSPRLGHILLIDGTLAFTVVVFLLWRRAPVTLVAVQVLAAVLAALAAAFLFNHEVPAVIGLLTAFLVITITAERAELAQLSMGPSATRVPVVVAAGMSLGAVGSLADSEIGARILGATLLLTCGWLLRDDISRRFIRLDGQRRFLGAALLMGTLWLAVAGCVWLARGTGDAAYDTGIHAVFLGFGMSMIMAHAPIIFPTVLSRPLPYRPVMWAPLGMLHVGMVARVVGDLLHLTPLHQTGGIMTVLSMLLFGATAAYSAARG